MAKGIGSYLAAAGLVVVLLTAMTSGHPQATFIGFALILTGLVLAVDGLTRK